MTQRVRVVYRKYDGALHWNHDSVLLGEDEYGVWVGTPAGTRVRRGTERTVVLAAAHVQLFPRDAWWTGSFHAMPSRVEIYCDITTVPSWPTPDEVTMVDLDLDVCRRRGGRVELLDEDEFAVHQVRYGYPLEIVERARATAEELFAAVTAAVEPFGSAYRPWLDRVR